MIEKNIAFDYVTLLSGQDYPIKSDQQIKEFFQANLGKSFIEFHAIDLASKETYPISAPLWATRIERWHFALDGNLRAVPSKLTPPFLRRRFPKGFQPFVGSQFWCLSRECVEYIYDFIHKNRGFVEFFNYVEVSDELFFQTILLNSPLRKTIVNNDLRYIEWTEADWVGTPKVLRKDNFNQLLESSQLFARKFDSTKDAEILDLIDQNILVDKAIAIRNWL